MTAYAHNGVYMAIIKTFGINAVDTKKLKFAAIDAVGKGFDDVPVLVIIKPGHPRRKKQHSPAAMPKN